VDETVGLSTTSDVLPVCCQKENFVRRWFRKLKTEMRADVSGSMTKAIEISQRPLQAANRCQD
jgi:hypothetical protein